METPYAKLLKAAMTEADNISQGELARLSGVPQPTIARILSGDTEDPKASTVLKLATALRIDVARLLSPRKGDSVDEAPAPYQSLSPKEETCLGFFRGLTEAQQDAKIRELQAEKSHNDQLIEQLVKHRGGRRR